MGGFPSGPNPSFAYDLPWPAVSLTPPFSEKRPAIETIETIEMIEMCWAPLAGDPLHMGARVVGRVGDIWDSGFGARVVGMGFAHGLGRFLKNAIRVLLVGLPLLVIFFFQT